jgi:hypothetical protein
MGYKDVVCILPHFTQLTQPFDLKYLELIIKKKRAVSGNLRA